MRFPHPALIAIAFLVFYALGSTVGLLLYYPGGWSGLVWVAYSFTFITLLVASLGLMRTQRMNWPATHLSRQSLWLSLPYLLALLYILFGRIPEHTFWLDEYTQLVGSWFNPSETAAVSSQPLLAYLNSHFIFYTKVNPILLSRLTSIFCVVSAYMFFVVMGNRLNLSSWFYLLLGSFFLFEPNIHFSALEARPVALGIMFMALFMLNLVQYHLAADRFSLWGVFISCLLFLMSLGMQPVVICGLLWFGLGIDGFLFKDKKSRNLCLATSAALLVFFPFQIPIILVSAKTNKFHEAWYGHFVAWLGEFKSENYLFYFNEDKESWILMSAVAAAVLFSFIKRKSISGLVFIMIGLTLLFPIAFDLLFKTIINWPLTDWYRSCFLIFSNVFLFSIISLPVKYWWRWVQVVAVSALVYGLTYYAGDNRKILYFRRDFSVIKKTIDGLFSDHDWSAYVTGDCRVDAPSGWCNNLFVGAEFYEDFPGQLNRGMVKKTNVGGDNGMVADYLSSTQTPRHLVAIVFDEKLKNIDTTDLTTTDSKFVSWASNNTLILATKEKYPPREGLVLLLEKVVKVFPGEARYMYPYELLTLIFLKSGDLESAQKWWKRMLELKEMGNLRLDHQVIREKLRSMESMLLEGDVSP